MKALTAIVKLTLRNAIRSHVFQLLLGFLILCVALIPTTVGGSTAMDFIRVSLLYSLSGIGTILSLSALWVGCQVMSSDIDSYQLHMVVSKPVSRVTIWFGKFLGVLLLHLVLLTIAAAAIFGVVLWRFNHGDFPQSERDRIRREVLVGRRVFLPERPDYEKQALEALEKKILERQKGGRNVDLSERAQEREYKDCLKEAVAKDSEVEPALYEVKLDDGRTALKFSESRYRSWVYKNVPDKVEKLLYLRYRPYVGKVKSENQRNTAVRWFVQIPARMEKKTPGEPEPGGEAPRYFQSLPPMEVMSGEFHEIKLLGNRGIVSPDGEVRIRVQNLDPKMATQVYTPADGPKLLVEVTGFLGNYARAILAMALQLTMMALLSCALGGFLTLPTAVFVSMSYLVFNFMTSYLTDSEFYVKTGMDKASQGISLFIRQCLIMPLDRFDFTELVASGELIEWSFIFDIAWSHKIAFVLFALFVWLGIVLYRRREIGLVIRK
jgi:hypothetical protein